MEINYTIEFRGDFIYVRNPPEYEMTAQSSEVLWSAVIRVCQKHDCRLVYREGKIKLRRMNWKEMNEWTIRVAKDVPGLRLACFLEGYHENELSRFLQMAAVNRGLMVGFFSDREEALRWLGVSIDG